ncbi:MAG: relaxase MobL [Clostridia bacterium]|nr:relaxase MobL [Clostridia bacterium]
MSKVISKLRCYNPSKLDSTRGNIGHLYYISRRSNALLYDNKTVFGRIGNSDLTDLDLKDIGRHIADKSNNKTNIYRGIISLKEEDALELGYDKVSEWESLMKEKVYDIAGVVNIDMPNAEWIAVVHLKKGNPHLHYMMWDKEQQINRYYISLYQQNTIREILTKHIFENELSKYYEIKNETKNKLRDRTIALELKAFNESVCKGKLGYLNIDNKELKEIRNKLYKILEELPKTGSLKYAYMSENIKKDIDEFMEFVIDKNTDLKEEYSSYIENSANIGKLFGNSNKIEIKLKVEQELKKIIGNQFLSSVKDMKYDKLNEKIFINNLLQEIYRMISVLNESNNSKKELYRRYNIDMSKQAQIDYTINKQNSSNIEW